MLVCTATFVLSGILSDVVAQNLRPNDTTRTNGLRYPIHHDPTNPFSTSGSQSPMLLRQPSNINQEIVYDPETKQYVLSEKVGELNYRPPRSLSMDEYRRYHAAKSEKNYWREKSLEESGAGPSFMKNLRLGNQSIDKVFGSDLINIKTQGNAELIFGYTISKNEDPRQTLDNQKNGSFLFKEKIMVNVNGNIGDKFELALNYNTEATFDFENKTKLEYAGKEDEIIKKIEAGDISFDVPGSLIKGSQSLFGVKTELQFGKLYVTTVLSHQRGESSTVTVQGGAQLNDFEVEVDEYDANRHYFLTHFFRDHYNEWLQNLPYIESQLQIQQIEVWVTNRQDDYTESRNVVAFMDLAEGHGPDSDTNFYASELFLDPRPYSKARPSENNSNSLYRTLANNSLIRDKDNLNTVVASLNTNSNSFSEGTYAKLENARPLSSREYTVNRELGYISLNSPLRNDEILAVAFTFTYRGKTYKVGELTSDITAPNVLILKLLKGTIATPKYPNWDLMMKNIYAIGAYQVSPENFVLNVLYKDDNTGVPVNYLSEDSTIISSEVYRTPLLKVLELDNLDSQNEPNPNGLFDFIEGVTVTARNGRIIFPLIEPFGKDLRDKIVPADAPRSRTNAANRIANKYTFEELYSRTQSQAEQVAEKNKFVLKGQYESASGSDIQLNAMNISPGSVKVTAGGITLDENVDYTVDYTLGRVKIINPGLMESGTPINISVENNALFNLQTKTLLGTHFDYRFSENFNIGATFMRLKETPYTKKVNMGDEPIANTIWGLNASYRTKSQFITTLVDKLPLIETKEPSSILLEGEFAHLIPGQAKAIGKNGQAYIDDFEAAQTEIEMKSHIKWKLASPPLNNPNFGNYGSDSLLKTGYGRAKLAWYVIDPLFYKQSGLNPGNQGINDDLRTHYARRIKEQEIFPEKENEVPGENYLSILDLAYYPNERGPYNYDPNLQANGKLTNPEDRWGGIMREITGSTDFETSNIEFIEFWLMDPYASRDSAHSGGELYLQLGEISEDILHDDKKSFESGFPSDPNEIVDVDTTVWGRVPRGQALNNNFLSEYQDVGLDGLNSNDEKSFFGSYLENISVTDENAIREIENDPSADDFMYFLSPEHDASNHGIIERYKDYNNMEGNSPFESENSQEYVGTSTGEPDIEDINDDNTKNELESYFEYRVSLHPNDFNEVGENYIVDMIEAYHPDAGNVKWYQFRIPLADYRSRHGSIEDFKSVRFMRMLLTGFRQDVILRFATLDLIRSDWRQYKYDLDEAGPAITEIPENTVLEVSAVNIEENSQKSPVNYVLPPQIDRVIDPSNPQVAHLNEQSLLLKVKDLSDGDARAVFKNESRDLRQYEHLKMWIHAEALPNQEGSIEDGELTAFIRIGSDYINNYYEYELPLKLTSHAAGTSELRDSVWKNEMDLVMQDLVELKKRRNRLVREDPSNFSTQSIYMEQHGNNTMKVKGNPNLGDIRQIMLGVRNPGDQTSFTRTNDGLPKSAEVWFNELRVTDFDNKGGWATNGRAQIQLADFGVVSFAGSKSTPGFGSIEEKVHERSMEEINQYDISSNLELGKFFPEKAKVSIPLYVGASKTIINPEYFPKDPDIKFEDILDEAQSKEEKDSLKRISQDHTARASINVTNLRWNKKFKKIDILSPANLSTTVGYSQTLARNYTTDYNNLWKYNAGINYTYSNRPKNIQPFRKVKALRKPSLRIIRDFNFNPHPSSFTFGTQMAREYQEIKMRNVFDDIELLIEPTVNKDFVWERNYSVKWDLSRSLKATYKANNSARIGEPYGQSDLFKPNNEAWKDSVWNSIKDGGRNMNFNQSYDLSYNVPINKIPLLNWVSLNTSYGGTFSWVRGPEVVNPETNNIRDLGHTIKNSNNMKVSNNLNMRSLYNKSKYLKRIETKYSGNSRNNSNTDETRYKEVSFEKRTFFRAGDPRTINHKLKTENVTVLVLNRDGEPIEVDMEIESENKISIISPVDASGATVIVNGKIPKGENPIVFVAENSIRLLTGIKTINASWSRSSGSVLSGYRPSTNYFGADFDNDDDFIRGRNDDVNFNGAPGFNFIAGVQDTGFVRKAIDKRWISEDETFSQPYEMNTREEVNFRITYEPFKGLRIDLTANRSYSEYNEQIFFSAHDSTGLPNYRTPNGTYFIDNIYKSGSFSISIISILSAFEKPSIENDFKSESFEKFKQYRSEISGKRYDEWRQTTGASPSQQHYNGDEYKGYSLASQEVLVPAFLAAYTGTDPDKANFKPFFWSMMPNWNVTFDGLSKIEFIQRFLKTITLTHSYKSTYSVTGFGTNTAFYETEDGVFGTGEDLRGTMRDAQDDYIARFQYNSVSINESLSPLIGFNMTWHNSLLTKFDIGKKRKLMLNLNNAQINETRTTDYTIGAGYKFKEVPLWITTGGTRKQIKSDLNVRFDFTIRDNLTLIRMLDDIEEQDTDVTTGGKSSSIGLTADYVISENFSIQFFFDRELNDPAIRGNQYKNSTTQFGFSLRLSL